MGGFSDRNEHEGTSRVSHTWTQQTMDMGFAPRAFDKEIRPRGKSSVSQGCRSLGGGGRNSFFTASFSFSSTPSLGFQGVGEVSGEGGLKKKVI